MKCQPLHEIVRPVKNIGKVGVLPYIEIGDIDVSTKQYYYKDKASIEGCCLAKKNDILVSRVRPTRGAVTIVKEDELCVSSAFTILDTIDESITLNKYVFYALAFNKGFYSYLGSVEKGSSYPSCRTSDILKFEIPSFDKQYQEKIVKILEICESAIQKRKDANRLTDEFLKSTFLEMFGDPLRNSKGFSKRKIAVLASKERYAIKRGPFGGSLKKEIFVKSGYKVYEQKHVIKNDFTIGKYFIDAHKFYEMRPFAIRPDDILISCSGTIGKIAIVPTDIEEGIINQALLKITLDKKEVFPVYFKYLFENESVQQYLFGYTHGSAMKNVTSVGKLKAIELPIAPPQQQMEFVGIDHKVKQLKLIQHESEIELTSLFNSLMQRAFRGEL